MILGMSGSRRLNAEVLCRMGLPVCLVIKEVSYKTSARLCLVRSIG